MSAAQAMCCLLAPLQRSEACGPSETVTLAMPSPDHAKSQPHMRRRLNEAKDRARQAALLARKEQTDAGKPPEDLALLEANSFFSEVGPLACYLNIIFKLLNRAGFFHCDLKVRCTRLY